MWSSSPDDSWSPHTSSPWSSSLTSPAPSCPHPPSYTPHPVSACSQVKVIYFTEKIKGKFRGAEIFP